MELKVTSPPLIDLSGKVAVVTGASRGIGAACARLFARCGAQLVIMGRTESPQLLEVSEELSRFVKVLPLECDSSNFPAISSAYRQIKKEFGQIDVLVNNAGVLEDALLGMISPEMIQRLVDVNLSGPILHLQAASRIMARKGGSIINLSSIIGRFGNEGQAAYGATKAGMIGLTLSAAKELAPRLIRVNAVAPGFIGTDMTAGLPPEKYDLRVKGIKMKRVGTADDVANVILFLASDLSTYVTGQVIGVDGGMLI